ncbi:SDR family oxidoreductase [Algicella marina]|uniref:SDR family NAD(P)-dependent oxidoreductase n=1 Tax=Algicella marina TaxID=2683284 RepID=A0A6P1SWR9_9RHOB|nr:SDR family NAD(P)-dependent oxidoreductase [Algicella marina]QHQ33931.1 SDR family NAD(P)-dependent oxidoreductase [Algicella marina]
MRTSGRKYVITGAGRGLGAALATVMADAGARLVLLARSETALQGTADTIFARTGQRVATMTCDLADRESSAAAGAWLAREHADLDGVIHNGAMWLPAPFSAASDADIETCVASAAIGSLILTRHLLPNLLAREHADIHTVVSTSGVQNYPLDGVSVAFKAAKFAQAGFVQGLTDELAGTGVRVTAVFPGDFDDASPVDPGWTEARADDAGLTGREVVDAILFILNLPPSVTVPSLVIESRTGNGIVSRGGFA